MRLFLSLSFTFFRSYPPLLSKSSVFCSGDAHHYLPLDVHRSPLLAFSSYSLLWYLLSFHFHELIFSRGLTHASSFRPGAFERSHCSFPVFVSRVNPLFPHPLLASPFLFIPSVSWETPSLFWTRTLLLSYRYVACRLGGGRQSGRRSEWRSRRGSRSEETPGVLCSAPLLIAVNTITRWMIEIVLITRSRINDIIAARLASRVGVTAGLTIDDLWGGWVFVLLLLLISHVLARQFLICVCYNHEEKESTGGS